MEKQVALIDDIEIEEGTVLDSTALVPATTPMEILANAVSSGLPVEMIEKLMELQRNWDVDRAREAYAESMRDAQEAMPIVVKDAKGHNSRYARLENVLGEVRPVYTKHGFSLSFGVQETEKENVLRVYCDCLHCHGHCERIACNFPIDNTGNKNSTQAIGSTMSYARRYLTLLVFNIAIADEDNDGQTPAELIDEKQIAAINKELDRFPPGDDKAALAGLCKWLEIESLDQMPSDRFPEALKAIRKKADKEVVK